MRRYTIHTEGRELNEVIKTGNTVRVDLHSVLSPLKMICELQGFDYEVKGGHELPNGTKVKYILITGKKGEKQAQKLPKNKRYVLKSAGQLGTDSGYIDEKTGRFIPTWYIIDKTNNEIVDTAEGEGARSSLKKMADRMNLR